MTKTQPKFLNEPIYQPQRKLTVIVIGAGASGLFLTYKLQRHFGDIEIKVFEKNAGVSGTWFENVLYLVRCFCFGRGDIMLTFMSQEISRMCMRYPSTQ